MRRAVLLLLHPLSARAHPAAERNPEFIDNDHSATLNEFTRLFIPLAMNAQRIVVFDVGANDGSWSRWTGTWSG